MREPTFRYYGEVCHVIGKRTIHAPTRLAGVLTLARLEDGKRGNTGSPIGAFARGKPASREGQAGPLVWRMGPYY